MYDRPTEYEIMCTYILYYIYIWSFLYVFNELKSFKFSIFSASNIFRILLSNHMIIDTYGGGIWGCYKKFDTLNILLEYRVDFPHEFLTGLALNWW